MGRLLGIALAVAVIAAGFGADAARPPVETVTTTLYFLTSDRQAPQGVRRAVSRESPHALEALRALLAGPTTSEEQAGVTTAIPEAVKLLDFRVERDSGAVVELSGLGSIEDGVERVRVITQITRTLIGLSGIENVRLRDDGEPWGLWLMSGGVADDRFDYDFLDGLIVGSPVPGAEAVTGDTFPAVP